MNSLAKSSKRSKKTERLGSASLLRSEHYEAFDVDSTLAWIQALIPLGLMQIQELLEEAIRAVAGERYERQSGARPGRRSGSNPGSGYLAGQRPPFRIPRVQHVAGGEIPVQRLAQRRGTGDVDEVLLKRVLYGISCRNDEAAATAVPGAIGLSSSTVSRPFVRARAKRLKALQDRDLRELDLVAIFLDGTTFADMTMVVAIGVTLPGEKQVLGFLETGTENEQVLTPFLQSLEERGLHPSRGLLVVIDGGKGLRAAVRPVWGKTALCQRWQWHKRANVLRQ